MKLLSTILIISAFFASIDIGQIREDFKNANESKEVTTHLLESLKTVDKSDEKTLIAYKGAALTLKAKHSKKKEDKKAFFKEGVALLEYAIERDPQNIEIRFVRLSIQENTPPFLKYKKSIGTDKDFLLANFKNINSLDLKMHINLFVQQSKSFSDTEKEIIANL